MTPSDTQRFPDDLQEVAALLRDNRPEATALELDGVKQQVRFRASRAASGHVQKGSTMKSRLAMTAMLVSGLLMSGTGATLAVSGSTDNAATAQYPAVVTPTPTPAPTTRSEQPPVAPPTSGVLPAGPTSGGEEAPAPAPTDGGTAPATAPKAAPKAQEEAPAAREQGAQPAQQVAASTGDGQEQLPFTGFAAIPILLGGIALMGGGLVMRRRTAA